MLLPPASGFEVIELVLPVCVSVCVHACAFTTEPFDVRDKKFYISGSSLMAKVIGQRSRSQCQDVKLISNSTDFFVI